MTDSFDDEDETFKTYTICESEYDGQNCAGTNSKNKPCRAMPTIHIGEYWYCQAHIFQTPEDATVILESLKKLGDISLMLELMQESQQIK